jgi:glutamate carboxypeptidase
MDLPAMLADIAELVGCESPSADLAAVARSADTVSAVGRRLLGASPDRLVIDGRTHLRWRFGSPPSWSVGWPPDVTSGR